MVPKPAISFDLSDPFCETAGKVIYSLYSVMSTGIMKAHAEEAVCVRGWCALKPIHIYMYIYIHIHTYITYIPWIHKSVEVTTGCGISHNIQIYSYTDYRILHNK
jgi:hypothetical protein